ncbi:MAG: Stk1 family PASTA domain-containing Ser/Thr kinase [Clostridia bacterium]|nr:Stk1 family PASTA domain-containing Ser/Thr kinase [Clostridia bacterium]
MNLENKIIGNRYKILEKIGTGGMATVYKAKCNLLNRYVAIKILREEFTTDEEFVRKFNVEAQAAASLSHPNIVSIYDVGKEGNLYYIVMELIQGKTLKEIIKEDGALPWKWSINIAIQIASALEVAHKNNIVHRDIKPHNIIITEEGIAKVTDFGIAKAVSNSTITAFGNTIGSVHYFSPEHARGGFTDGKTDIYSLGIVMYEMLTGRVPFEADTPVSIALKHMQEKPIEPSKINPNVPYAVNKIILKAIEKEPSLRYASANQMLRDLNSALKNPTGKFVEEEDFDHGFTQRISVAEIEKNMKNGKKKSKLKQYFEKHPKMKVAALIISAIVIIFASFGITYGILELTRLEDVYIPDLVGKTLEEAETILKDLKLEYEIEERFDSEVELGKIISQDPSYVENYKIKEKTLIKIVVSKGTEIVKVPKLIGLKYEEAVQKLEELNLIAQKIEEKSTKVQEDYVIKQEVKEGSEINAGETVKVYVSIGTGIKQTSVPYVVGKNVDEAKKELEDKKLKVVVEEEETSSKSAGTVLKQSVDAGQTVDEETTIKITVAKLPETKSATVLVNVKSITGGYTSEDGKTQKVTLTVTVNDSEIFDQDVDKNSINVNAGKATGTGTVKVKVLINGIKEREEEVDLKSRTSITLD